LDVPLMRVLITGDCGFVGHHLRLAFMERGDEVYGLDLKLGSDALDYFRRNTADLVHCPAFDLAIHCAAVIGGRASIDGSPLAVATNLALDSWFFRWLEQSETPRAVYFSSSAAYPVDLQNDLSRPRPLHEDDIRTERAANIGRPDATYGWAKLTGEQLARHARRQGKRVIIVRPFSGYGPDQPLDYPFPSFIDRAVRLADPFDIWGDGEQVRDWVHIDDVVGATLALLEADRDFQVNCPVNIGTGRPTSFNELAKLVIDARGGGYQPQIRHLVHAPAGVAYRVADTARLRRFYQPRISLEQGISEALARGLGAA
jgi:nucleoside-diphosphate-sugar epimerase